MFLKNNSISILIFALFLATTTTTKTMSEKDLGEEFDKKYEKFLKLAEEMSGNRTPCKRLFTEDITTVKHLYAQPKHTIQQKTKLINEAFKKNKDENDWVYKATAEPYTSFMLKLTSQDWTPEDAAAWGASTAIALAARLNRHISICNFLAQDPQKL